MVDRVEVGFDCANRGVPAGWGGMKGVKLCLENAIVFAMLLPRMTDMPDSADKNDARRTDGEFNTTHWSVVLMAGQSQSALSAAALESLCRAYWKPIYVFARGRQYGEADAKDLTQHFFYILLERNDFSGVDPGKGKFRTFLLTAFTHFLANERERANTFKRGGGKIIVPLDELAPDELGLPEATTDQSAVRWFDRQWAKAVVQQALVALKAELEAAGKEHQFAVLKAFLAREPAPGDYSIAAHELGMADASVPVLVHRLRLRYRQLVRAQVAQTITSPAELDEEMRYLVEVLNQEN